MQNIPSPWFRDQNPQGLDISNHIVDDLVATQTRILREFLDMHIVLFLRCIPEKHISFGECCLMTLQIGLKSWIWMKSI